MKSILIKRFVLPFADIIMNTKVSYYLGLIKKISKYSKKELKEWQLNQLHELLNHAYHNTNYYKNLFNTHGIVPDDINRFEDLRKIPILTKKIIKDNYQDLIPTNINKINYTSASTGGSSGDPLKYLLDKNSWSFQTALNIYFWEKTSYNYGDSYLALGSTSLFVNKKRSLKHEIYYWIKGKYGINGINLSDDAIKQCLDFIKNKKIKYLYGYASSLYLIAKYVEKNKINIDIKVCFPTSEVLTQVYRDTIKNVFKCEIIDSYGASDGGVSAYEIIDGYYFVGYNSIVNTQGMGKEGEDIYLVDLFNYAMPFINYEVGDAISFSQEVDFDDYNGQYFNKIFGRTSDIIELKNGRKLTGPGFTIIFKDLPVEKYSIQKDGLNSLIINVKKTNGYKKNHEDIILSSVKNMAGEDCNISINYNNTFELSNSGKHKYIMN